jgi:hypothetical protein
METQERLLECPLCGTDNPPQTARWNDEESSYEAICQSSGKKFSKTVQLEQSAS